MADGPRITNTKRTELEAREARLARALRDNLARRKAQSRARRTEKKPGGADKPPA